MDDILYYFNILYFPGLKNKSSVSLYCYRLLAGIYAESCANTEYFCCIRRDNKIERVNNNKRKGISRRARPPSHKIYYNISRETIAVLQDNILIYNSIIYYYYCDIMSNNYRIYWYNKYKHDIVILCYCIHYYTNMIHKTNNNFGQ